MYSPLSDFAGRGDIRRMESTRRIRANLSKYGRCLQKLIGKRLRFVMIYDEIAMHDSESRSAPGEHGEE